MKVVLVIHVGTGEWPSEIILVMWLWSGSSRTLRLQVLNQKKPGPVSSALNALFIWGSKTLWWQLPTSNQHAQGKAASDIFVGFIAQNIISLLTNFSFCSFAFVKRGIVITHELAHLQPHFFGRRLWETDVPKSIVHWALDDMYAYLNSNLIQPPSSPLDKKKPHLNEIFRLITFPICFLITLNFSLLCIQQRCQTIQAS